MGVNLPNSYQNIINSSNLEGLLTNMAQNINAAKVATILATAAGICVALVFLWWGVRKVSSMLMAAFRNGKLSI